MTTEEAKAVLLLYRPGTDDQEDSDFAEALRLCEEDTALRRWFEDHCSVYQSIRLKLKQVSVPEGLAQQIIAEQKVATSGFGRVPIAKTAIAAIGAVIALCFLIFQWLPLRENTGFSGFRQRMVSTALRNYTMDFTSQDMTEVRSFLQRRGAPSDFVLPPALGKAELLGCVATTWQGKSVSMICFRSGHSPNPQKPSDLWLFVTEKPSIDDAPETGIPSIATLESHGVVTANWMRNGKIYLLAIEGDEEWLRKYL